MSRRALFLFPSDRMGGAERITRTLAIEAARSGRYDEVHCYIQCWERSGTLDALECEGNVILEYSYAESHFRRIAPLTKYLASRSYDLVFSSHLHFNAICSLMRRLGKLDVARLVSRESTTTFDRDFGRFGIMIPWMYAAYGAQDLIVCQTQKMKASISKNTDGKHDRLLKVIPNPIDMEWITEGRNMAPPPELNAIPASRTRIVWCGRLVPVKAPLRAIEALHALHELGRRDVHLIMIGDGPLRPAVLERGAKLGVDGHLTMVGHQAFPSATMARCHMGMLTSEVEGFPNVILEMLASGNRSVVSTECADGLEDIPAVRLALARDGMSIAKAFIPLLDNEVRDATIDSFVSRRQPRRFFDELAD